MSYNNVTKIVSNIDWTKVKRIVKSNGLDLRATYAKVGDKFKTDDLCKLDMVPLFDAPIDKWVKKIHLGGIQTESGRILRNQKPGTIKAKSVPTQQYIDEMLDVAKTERATEIAKNGHGWLNERAVADAKYAFTEGTKVEPVITTKVNLKDWIKAKFDFKTADELTRAEAKGTGKLPDRIARAREDAYYAFTGEELNPTLGKKFKHLFMRATGKEKPCNDMYLKICAADNGYNKGLGLEL